jgi:carbohydrate binding protein with CBM4/9 domain
VPTLVATAYNTPAYVLLEADWGDNATVAYAGVRRRNTVTGEEVLLRPYVAYDDSGNLLLSCHLGLWWDTEPPLNVLLEYCTFAADTPALITTNSDFEVALAPWVDSAAATAVRSNAFAHTGSWSAQLTPVSTNGTLTNNTDTAPFIVGVPLNMQAWAMSPQGYNSVILTMQIQFDDGELFSFSSDPVTLDDGLWQYITATYTPTKPGYVDFLQFQYLGPAPITTIFYIDDIGIYQDQPVASIECATATVVSDSVWLKSPLYPCSDVEVGLCNPAMDFDCEEDSRVSYVGMADDTLNPNTVLSEPANRKYPVPTSRVRRAPTSQLQLLAHDCDARDAVLLANDPGTPLLFQAPADYCIPDRYISVGAETETRISIDQREDFRLMSLPYAVVQRPEGPANGICGARIMDLCDIYTSWTAMVLGGLSYYDLLLGLASNDGPTSTPPAEDLRTWGDVLAEFADWNAVQGGGSRDWGELKDGL